MRRNPNPTPPTIRKRKTNNRIMCESKARPLPRKGRALTVCGGVCRAVSFPEWHSLHPGDPSVACATAPLKGAPRARRVAMRQSETFAAKRCPNRRRIQNLCREALPLLGEVARQRRRGRQSSDTSRREKKECTKNAPVGDGRCAVPQCCTLH